MKKEKIGTCTECGKEFIITSPIKKMHTECRLLRDIKKREEAKAARFSIYKRDDFKCVYCGRSPIEDNVKLVLDHISPYIDTHDSSVYNLITSCDECNKTKASHILSKDIYNRIIARNILNNKGISDEQQQKIQYILTNVYATQKHDNE